MCCFRNLIANNRHDISLATKLNLRSFRRRLCIQHRENHLQCTFQCNAQKNKYLSCTIAKAFSKQKSVSKTKKRFEKCEKRSMHVDFNLDVETLPIQYQHSLQFSQHPMHSYLYHSDTVPQTHFLPFPHTQS